MAHRTLLFFSRRRAVVFALALILGGVAFVSCKPKVDERAQDPEKYVRLALKNAYASLPALPAQREWVADTLNARHEIELGLAFKEIDMPMPVDSQVLSLMQLARLDMKITRDPAVKQLLAQASLAAAGAPILSADAYLSEDDLALRVPQGFDSFITVDPRRVTEDVSNSAVGSMLEQLPVTAGEPDDTIYDTFMELLAPYTQTAPFQFVNDTQTLFSEAEYAFLDKAEDGLYRYSLRIQKDSFVNWYHSLVRGLEDYSLSQGTQLDTSALYYFSVTDDLQVELHVRDDLIELAQIETKLLDGVACKIMIDANDGVRLIDNLNVHVRLENPNSSATQAERRPFDVTSALSPYIMIDEMPAEVTISITTTGDTKTEGVTQTEGVVLLSQRGGDRTEINWNYYWDNTGDKLDNFRFSAAMTAYAGDESGTAKISASGTVYENAEQKKLHASFNNISWLLSEFGEPEQAIGLQLQFGLKAAPDAEIDYDRAGTAKLTELSPLQLLGIYSNFIEDPVIGGLFGGQ